MNTLNTTLRDGGVMDKKDIDQKLLQMFEMAHELTHAPIPVVKHRAEMIVGLLEELMVSVVDGETLATFRPASNP